MSPLSLSRRPGLLFTSKTNDMGLSRTLISMLALDVSRLENGSEEGLLQAFHQLNGR